MAAAGWLPEDFEDEIVEVWPECWPRYLMFESLQTQWRIAPMGGPVGLDYSAVYPLLDKFTEDKDEWQEAFAELRVMEAAALRAIARRNAKP